MAASLFPLGQRLAFLDRPPLADLRSKSCHHFRVVSRQVLFFLRILEQVEELRTLFLARMGRLVAVDFSVVSKEQFPLSLNGPAEDKGVLGVFDIGDVMGKTLA